jgi:selenoprotein W-related protein
MVERLLEAYEHRLDSVTLLPGRGGVFEVRAGDTTVFSKKATGRHAEVAEVVDAIAQLLG